MNLCLATPTMHKLVSAGYAKTVAAIGMVCAKHNIPWSMEQVDTAFIVDARNKLVEQFLSRPERTHLLMVDSDSELGFAAVEKIITCGFPFASLPFCMRQIDLQRFYDIVHADDGFGFVNSADATAGSLTWCVDLADNNQPVVDGWVKARRTGFGCVLLAREVLERDWAKGIWFNRTHDVNSNGQVLLSEDMSFCQRFEGIAQPMLCVDQLTLHNGTFSFGAKLIDDQRYFKQLETPETNGA